MRNKIILLLVILLVCVGAVVVIGVYSWNNYFKKDDNSESEITEEIITANDATDRMISSMAFNDSTCELSYVLTSGETKIITSGKIEGVETCKTFVYGSNDKYYAYWNLTDSPDTDTWLVSLEYENYPVKIMSFGPSSEIQDILFVQDYVMVLSSLDDSVDPSYPAYAQSITVYNVKDIFHDFSANYIAENQTISNFFSKTTDLGTNSKLLTSMRFANGEIIVDQGDKTDYLSMDFEELKP
jgi:hypothetical protein